ncbi:PAAR domain-containing protein [Caballeronia insecticola]|uniref:GP29 n=1 Tax=Caballeronia insecticola TaxID=758793 RepID=R4X3Z6_9BURK|nr:PAAR domain-containing protein [Caballeronia insecticola]BAN26857.1 GP29 [Caballeronia insecticola]
MRDNLSGRDVARLGDKTDHGGAIIEAASDLSHRGVAVALDKHLTECPKCGGTYPIIATSARKHRGVKVASIGDMTACGARIIGSEA